MRNISFGFAMVGMSVMLSACGTTDFDVKLSPPDVPLNITAAAPAAGSVRVSVVGQEKLNFTAKPLTSVCFPVNFKISYADAVTKSIEQTVANAAAGKAGPPRSFTVTISDFNARIMTFFVDPFVFRHDAEVRITLGSREDVSGGQPISNEGAASIYHESPRDTSGFCDKGQDALAEALQKAVSLALANLSKAIKADDRQISEILWQSGS